MGETKIGKDRYIWLIKILSFITLGLYWAYWYYRVSKELKIHTDNQTHLKFPKAELGFVSWLFAFGGLLILAYSYQNNIEPLVTIGIFMIIVGYLIFFFIRFIMINSLRQHYIDVFADYFKDYMAQHGMPGRGYIIADPDMDWTRIVPGMTAIYPAGDTTWFVSTPPHERIRDEFGGILTRIYKCLMPFRFSGKIQDSLNRHWDFILREEKYFGEVDFI